MRFVPERETIGDPPRKVDALSDAVMITSRDGLHFKRQFMDAFIRPGRDQNNWGSGHGNNTPAWGLLQTSPGEISIYWCENYVGGNAHVRRGTLRLDGFASVNAPHKGGEFVTRPLTFSGKELVINYATSAVGSVRVELQGADGKPLNGLHVERLQGNLRRRTRTPGRLGRQVRPERTPGQGPFGCGS